MSELTTAEIHQLRNTETLKDVYPKTIPEAIIDPHTGRSIGFGIPVLDQEQIQRGDIPEKYIGIHSPHDVQASYTDSMFAAIRALQAEVLRLKNAFKYGISSYNGTMTAQTAVIADYADVKEEEPLWAIEEDGLEKVVDILGETTLKRSGNSEITIEEGVLTVDGTCYWVDDSVTPVADIKHSKLFLFLQTQGLDDKNIQIILRTAKTSEDDSAMRIAMEDYINTVGIAKTGFICSNNTISDENGNFTSTNQSKWEFELNALSQFSQFLTTNLEYSINFNFGAISTQENSYFYVIDRYANIILTVIIQKDYMHIKSSTGETLATLPINMNNGQVVEPYEFSFHNVPESGCTFSIKQGTDIKIDQILLGQFFNIGCFEAVGANDTASIYFNNIRILFANDTAGYRYVNIDLKSLCNNILKLPETDKLNIQTIISRKVAVNGIETGTNFIWFSIANSITSKVLAEGYWNGMTLTSTKENNALLDDKFSFYQINLSNLISDKCKIYSKDEDFSEQTIASRPTDDTYAYKAAHITIRSVEGVDELNALKNHSLKNELIWDEDNEILYIKSKDKFIKIGSTSGNSGGGTDTDIMTKEEIAEKLAELGIIRSENGNWELNPVSGITFINQETGNKFDYSVDPYGALRCQKPITAETLYNRLTKQNLYIQDGSNYIPDTDMRDSKNLVRGIIGRLGLREGKTAGANITEVKDIGLYADRLKIGAWYAPESSTTAYGCSHGYIELENTGNSEFNLKGVNLYYTYFNESNNTNELVYLPLTGVIPAGGTYLIRCKQYNDASNPNCFINVNEYDQEWYITKNGKKELLDLTYIKGKPYGFMLYFGTKWKLLTYDTSASEWKFGIDQEITPQATPIISNPGVFSAGGKDYKSDKYPNVYDENYIDSVYFGALLTNASGFGYWTNSKKCLYSALNADGIFYPNAIMKNTFELDPAKQAFQSLNTTDSSRARNANDADFQIVPLDDQVISFPKTKETYPVSKFSPKASFQKKTVITDKNMINLQKPNMVTCSFGIDAHTTKTFNWISGGYFDEYVWIRKKGTSVWNRFQSYITLNTKTTPTDDSGYQNYTKYTQGSVNSNNIADINTAEDYSYTVYTFTKNTSNPLRAAMTRVDYAKHHVVTQSAQKYKKDGTKDGKATVTTIIDEYVDEYSINDISYARISNVFAGTDVKFTSHKCIVQILEASPSEPQEYEYIVGRTLRNGDFDTDHCSEIQTFKIYPSTYRPVIYQTSDQQGFHWMEYQVWAAAADQLNSKINADLQQIKHIYTLDQIIKNAEFSNPIYTLKLPSSTILNVNSITKACSIVNTKIGDQVIIDGTGLSVGGSPTGCTYTTSNTQIVVTMTSTSGSYGEVNGTISTITYVEKNPQIIPVVLNTGDMTQSGCRINEWLDYYNAGYNLFNHLEQVNVVGNNDLCGTDPTQLGTGDDNGKSNGYYYNLFYCYETDINIPTIINNKYVPSTYYIDINNTRLLLVNSELTSVNCDKWYGLKADNGEVINAYTGWSMKTDSISSDEVYDNSFTSVYTMLYDMTTMSAEYRLCSTPNSTAVVETLSAIPVNPTNNDPAYIKVGGTYYKRIDSKRIIAAMHEMPFTVITDDNLAIGRAATHRSLSGATTFSLCGAHVNQMTTTDVKAMYWFSRLMEYRRCLLVLGGHKHTYSCTYPLREYYYYGDNNSYTNGPMKMSRTLQNDIADFEATSSRLTNGKQVSLTKRPFTNHSNLTSVNDTSDHIIPVLYKSSLPEGAAGTTQGTVYFMCQSTGFKLFSNKELPSPKQKFSRFLPKSNVVDGKADTIQRSPMYSITDVPSNITDNFLMEISLIKLLNIQPAENAILSPIYFGKNATEVRYLKDNNTSGVNLTTDSAYGSWETNQSILLLI